MFSKIKALVQKGRWTKGDFAVSDPSSTQYCLVGFTNLVTNQDNLHLESSAKVNLYRQSSWDAYYVESNVYDLDVPISKLDKREKMLRRIWLAIRMVTPKTKCEFIEEWNDRKTTKQEDILKVLEIAEEIRPS